MGEAELFWIGKSQAIRLPDGYRFEGSKVYIQKMCSSVVLIPENNPWLSKSDSLDRFAEDFTEERDQPKQEDRKPLLD